MVWVTLISCLVSQNSCDVPFRSMVSTLLCLHVPTSLSSSSSLSSIHVSSPSVLACPFYRTCLGTTFTGFFQNCHFSLVVRFEPSTSRPRTEVGTAALPGSHATRIVDDGQVHRGTPGGSLGTIEDICISASSEIQMPALAQKLHWNMDKNRNTAIFFSSALLKLWCQRWKNAQSKRTVQLQNLSKWPITVAPWWGCRIKKTILVSFWPTMMKMGPLGPQNSSGIHQPYYNTMPRLQWCVFACLFVSSSEGRIRRCRFQSATRIFCKYTNAPIPPICHYKATKHGQRTR